MHLAVNLSLKKANVRLGHEITEADLHLQAEIPLTERIAVSQVNAIYDPLGLLAPLTIRYKLTLQKLSSLYLGWDEELQGEINSELGRILAEMVTTPDIKFPRAVLHADAGVLGWWQTRFCGRDPRPAQLEKPHGLHTHSVRLLMAKARQSYSHVLNCLNSEDGAEGTPNTHQTHHLDLAGVHQAP